MSGLQRLVGLIVLALIAAGVIIAVDYRTVQPKAPVDDRVLACYALIPADRRAGLHFKYEPDTKTATVDVDAEETNKSPTKEQLDSFIQCLHVFIKDVRLATASQPAAPLGEVADHWSASGQVGLKLTLMPGSNNEVLNNLRFGPASGDKSDIVAAWCKGAAACVRCDPQEPTPQTLEVLVRLLPGSRTKKVQMPGSWEAPKQAKPWQLVDQKGRRFFYECEPAG